MQQCFNGRPRSIALVLFREGTFLRTVRVKRV
jgi:hypothetical protein